MISNEGVGDAVRDGLRGANHSNSLAIARICNDADRPKPRPHTHEEIVNTFLRLGQRGLELVERLQRLAGAEGIGVDLGQQRLGGAGGGQVGRRRRGE